jgi:CheY-like chemotaxis protein
MVYERLLHILADESRVQLGLIQDTTDGLLASAADSPLREALERVHHGVWELSTLISDISDFYAHSAGQLSEAESDFDLRVTLDGVRTRFSRCRPQSDWIALTKVRHDVPTLLRGRPARLQDILLGAASGALDSRSPGSLRVDVTKGWERDGRVELIIHCVLCPQQPPTPEEVARFREVLAPLAEDGPLLRPHLRTELAKRLAHASEGSLRAVEGDEEPLAFELRMPFSMRAMPAVAPDAPPAPALRGHRVLVVDGAADRRSRTDALTRLWGMETEAVGSGREALHALRRAVAEQRPCDLVLVDAELEDMAGMTLGGLVRLEPAAAGALMVLQFGVGLRGDGATAEKVGFDAYLPRSLPIPELREALTILLQRRASERPDRSLLTRHSLADLQLEGVRILLVGSDPLGALVLEAVLGRKGFRVERAPDLAAAAERCEHHRYELIILDLGQISASDLSLASGLKALVDERGPTPVAALFEASGLGEAHDLAGFVPDAAFPKPVDLEHICLFCEGLLFPHLAGALGPPPPPAKPLVSVISSTAPDEPTTAFEPIWLDEATMGIGSLKRSVIDSFLAEMPHRVEAITAAIQGGDMATAEREVLGARAMALMIGAVSTARCLVALAEQVQERRLPEAHAMLSRFRLEAERSVARLREARARMAETPERAA